MKPSGRFRADLAPARLSADSPRWTPSLVAHAQKQRALNLVERIRALDRRRDAARKEH